MEIIFSASIYSQCVCSSATPRDSFVVNTVIEIVLITGNIKCIYWYQKSALLRFFFCASGSLRLFVSSPLRFCFCVSAFLPLCASALLRFLSAEADEVCRMHGSEQLILGGWQSTIDIKCNTIFYTYLYIPIHTYTYLYLLYIPVHTYTHLYTPIHTYTYLCIPVHTCTCLYIPIHTSNGGAARI